MPNTIELIKFYADGIFVSLQCRISQNVKLITTRSEEFLEEYFSKNICKIIFLIASNLDKSLEQFTWKYSEHDVIILRFLKIVNFRINERKMLFFCAWIYFIYVLNILI